MQLFFDEPTPYTGSGFWDYGLMAMSVLALITSVSLAVYIMFFSR